MGKLISSTLNGTDSWDIFQLIRRSLTLKPSNSDSEELRESNFTFISTLLAEWLSLLEVSNIPAKDFYSKLLDLFK